MCFSCIYCLLGIKDYSRKNRSISSKYFSLQICCLLSETNLTFPLSSNIQRTYYKSTVDPNVKLSKLTPHLDGYNLLRDQKLDSFNNYEPGFDFTEMEMKKFKIWPRGVVPYYIDVLSFGGKSFCSK